jgi:hypothetical protein
MELKGEVRRLRLAGQRNPVYRIIPQPEPSKSELTPPSITVSDMLANAGLIDSHERTMAARLKVKIFGETRLRASFA